MKVEISTGAEQKFEPITLTITLETRDELLDMYARHALRNRILVDHIDGYTCEVAESVGKPALVAAVNSIPDKLEGVPLLVALKKLILS